MENSVKSKLFVGIDVHKAKWSVSIYSEALHHKTFSQPASTEALKSYIDKHFKDCEIVCAYEACKFGYYIHRQLCSYGYQCMVVNPADIPTTNKETSDKTDPIDSRKIAKALRAGYLKSIYIPSKELEGHRQLFRYRKRLWSDLVRIKNRIKDKIICSGTTIPEKYDNPNWSKAFIDWLTRVKLPSDAARLTLDLLLQQYAYIKRHLMDVSIEVRKLQKHSAYKENARLLRQIPGIGPLTTVQLLVEIGDIHRFKNIRHFNSYIGLKPMTHSSGEKEKKGDITYRSHQSLRSSLVECAWITAQRDPALFICYEKLKRKHTAKRAIVIITRKLVSRIYHVLKTKEEYVLGIAQ